MLGSYAAPSVVGAIRQGVVLVAVCCCGIGAALVCAKQKDAAANNVI